MSYRVPSCDERSCRSALAVLKTVSAPTAPLPLLPVGMRCVTRQYRGDRARHQVQSREPDTVLELLSAAASAITSLYSRRCLCVVVTSEDGCMSKEPQISRGKRGRHAAAIDTRCAFPAATPDVLWLVDRHYRVSSGCGEGGAV